MDDMISISFGAFKPSDEDMHGIRLLLQQIFLKDKTVGLDRLTECLMKEETTLVIKQTEEEEESNDDQDDDQDEDKDKDEDGSDDDEDQVYGVTSLVDLSNKSSGAKDVMSYLNKKMKRKNGFEKTALVINERFVNLSLSLALPCLESILQDQRPFEKYILICKILKFKNKRKRTKEQGNKKKKRKQDDQSSSSSSASEVDQDDQEQDMDLDMDMDMQYQNPEEELFVDQVSNDCFFDFCVKDDSPDNDIRGGNWDEDDVKMTPFRRVLFLTRKQLEDGVRALKQDLTQSSNGQKK